MSIRVIKVPDVGEGIAEVELVAWHVQVGDAVAEDQVLADVMTDKANVEIPSPVAGRVAALGGPVGAMLAVGSALIRIETDAGAAADPSSQGAGAAAGPGAAGPAKPAAPPSPSRSNLPPTGPATLTPAPTAAASPAGTGRPSPVPSLPSRPPAPAPARSAVPATSSVRPPSPAAPSSGSPAGRPIASPALRRRAWELGIDLQQVTATGPAGRILQADLDAAVAAGLSQPPGAPSTSAAPAPGRPAPDTVEALPLVGLRRAIASRMQEAKRRIPHFSYVEELDVTEAEALRAALNARWATARGHLTLLPMLMRAVVIAVQEFPQVNAWFDDEAGVISRHAAVHVGIATQTPQGLLVPVVRHAEALDLWSMAAEVARLAAAARAGRATREELGGSTITISSLGALGGIVSTPVINRPEVAIVAVNRIVERPVLRSGAVVARKMMNLSSSFDHRIVDGDDAARFIQAVRQAIETPGLLLAN